MSTREEYETLLERYRRFLETAEMQASKGYYDLAVFSLEQALKLFLKACLMKNGLLPPRTHSLKKLIELLSQASKRGEPLKLLGKYALELGALQDAYITSRYLPRSYTREEYERLKTAVTEVMQAVRKTACP